jgi:hypothetical protein
MTSNKSLKIRVCITLDEAVVDKIQYLSANEFSSFSQYINLVFYKHIEKVEKTKKELPKL